MPKNIDRLNALLTLAQYEAGMAPAGPIRAALSAAVKSIDDAIAMAKDVESSGLCPGCGGPDGKHTRSCPARPLDPDFMRLLDRTARVGADVEVTTPARRARRVSA